MKTTSNFPANLEEVHNPCICNSLFINQQQNTIIRYG